MSLVVEPAAPPRAPRPSPPRLLFTVADVFGVDAAAIASPDRRAEVVRARDLASLILRERYNQTFRQIAIRYGSDDHAIVRGGIKRAFRSRAADAAYAAAHDLVIARLGL